VVGGLGWEAAVDESSMTEGGRAGRRDKGRKGRRRTQKQRRVIDRREDGRVGERWEGG